MQHSDYSTVRAVAIAIAIVLSVTTQALSARGAAIILDGLVIRIYDNTDLPASERATALRRAGEILARADIDAEWLTCLARREARVPRACNTPPAADELVVRLTASPAQASNVRHPLGTSIIDPTTGNGTLATVYVDKVDALAASAKAERSSVLGRAIAHEIGHLILGTNEHAGRGLMREVWTAEEIQRNRIEDWQFTSPELTALRARLARASSLRAAKEWRAGGAGPGS